MKLTFAFLILLSYLLVDTIQSLARLRWITYSNFCKAYLKENQYVEESLQEFVTKDSPLRDLKEDYDKTGIQLRIALILLPVLLAWLLPSPFFRFVCLAISLTEWLLLVQRPKSTSPTLIYYLMVHVRMLLSVIALGFLIASCF